MSKVKLASYLIITALIAMILFLHLVPAALIGMLVYLLAQILYQQLKRYTSEPTSRKLAVVLLVGLMSLGIYGAVTGLSTLVGDPKNLSGMLEMLQKTVVDMKADLPPALVQYLPQDWLNSDGTLSDLLKEHAQELSIAGKQGLHSMIQMLLSVAVALLLSLHQFGALSHSKPLTLALRERFMLIGKAFHDIVFAQIKISALNTLLTAIFLIGILPASGHPLPYANILVLITFVAGLLPVIGNLISNSVITIIAVGVSLKVAIACLLFLVVIHKLEYFVNAKIIGSKINAAVWEILLALLLMECLFGINGLLLAPILYSYIKIELSRYQLI
jgi:predicted PurR-regulated permease PerM